MKKIFAFFLCAIILAFSCVPAFAAGLNSAEQSVLANMSTPANMNGNSVFVPDSYINQAEARFNVIDMTDAQASEINGYINSGRSFLEGTGRSSFKELTADQVKTLMGYASAAADVLDLTAAVGSDGRSVKILSGDGEVVVDESNAVIKATGSVDVIPSLAVTAALVFCLAASCAGVLVTRRKAVQYEEISK